MITRSSSERLAEAMNLARRQWKAQREAETAALGPLPQSPPTLVIALSREAGTQAPDVAQAIGARLGWPVFDRALLEKMASEMGLHHSLLENLDEKRRSWISETLDAFLASPPVSETAFLRKLTETVLSLGAQGSCVIVGRGAAQILPAATTLRVRLVAPLAERIAAKAQRLGISREAAARQVEQTDRERTRFVKEHFHRDPTDPTQYDLVINSARFSTEECAAITVEALQRLRAQTRATPAAALT